MRACRNACATGPDQVQSRRVVRRRTQGPGIISSDRRAASISAAASVPDGQISKQPVQPPSQKHSGSLQTQITSTSLAIPAHSEGRFAIVTDVGCGMRWTRLRQETNDVVRGRRSRVVLTPRRWRQVGERNFIDDGGKKARSPGRARNKPLKPFAQGKAGYFR
jgi:hypothetical protein